MRGLFSGAILLGAQRQELIAALLGGGVWFGGGRSKDAAQSASKMFAKRFSKVGIGG